MGPKVLLTGGSGVLGTWLLRTIPDALDVLATQHRRPVDAASVVEVDLLDDRQVARLFERHRPDLVLHAAYEQGYRGVVDATRHLVRTGVPLVFTSTDNVFGGRVFGGRVLGGRVFGGRVFGGSAGPGRAGRREEHHVPDPVNAYGSWKAEAESLVLTSEASTVVRLPLLISTEPADDNSALIAAAAASGDTPTWYRDEYRQPALAEDVAGALWDIVTRTDRAGVWHLPGAHRLSRPRLASILARRLGVPDPGVVVDCPPADERPRDLYLGADRAAASIGWRPRPIR